MQRTGGAEVELNGLAIYNSEEDSIVPVTRVGTSLVGIAHATQDSRVRALAIYGADLIVGGEFTSVCGVDATNIARINLVGQLTPVQPTVLLA